MIRFRPQPDQTPIDDRLEDKSLRFHLRSKMSINIHQNVQHGDLPYPFFFFHCSMNVDVSGSGKSLRADQLCPNGTYFM
jgi:hypothetical protein